MAYKIELSPGIFVDLDEGLERTDIQPEERVAKSDDEPSPEELAAAEKKLNPDKNEEAPPKVTEKKEVEPEIKEEEPVVTKKKYKIKYNGEEKELDLDEEELITRLQKSEDYDKKMAKLAEDRRLVEPFKNVIDTEWFKQKLKEGIDSGEIEKPVVRETAPEDAVFEFEKRKLDPDFERVREAMRNWAVTLPPSMQVQLDSNVVVFNKEYDRISTILKEKRINKTLNLTEKKEVDKIIQKKEVSKEKARVEKGGSESDVTPNVQAKRVKELKKMMKEGHPGQRDAAAAEYLLATAFAKNKED